MTSSGNKTRIAEENPSRTPDDTAGVQVMGIINVTPDSFSDGGQISNENALLTQVEQMVLDGADIIDIGGESTRPFAEKVSAEEELSRVIPAIEAIKRNFHIPISIDTCKAEVADKAIQAGAGIINDISGLTLDPAMISVAIRHNVPVIIMHMQGTPRDMQINPSYDNVVNDIFASLSGRISWAEEQGLSRQNIIIDPGIGFGKTINHNLTIIRQLKKFTSLGCQVLVGHSRKAFIGTILSIDDPQKRDEATAVLSAICAANGAAILRVHDVARTVQAVKIVQAVMHGHQDNRS